MALIGYFTEQEAAQYRKSEDVELHENLQLLRNITKEDWIIRPFYITKRRWFRRVPTKPYYQIAVQIVGVDYQIMGLHNDDPNMDWYGWGTKEAVINFILGYLAGRQ